MLLSFLRRHIYPILLIILVAIICFITYKSGTFLTGWDTLHPEFNFNLNLERMINGVWRDEQGLGALAGHSHMADLPRVLMLWALHFALPLNSLRYSYVFLCLLLGPLGMYNLLKILFSSISNFKVQNSNIVAFLGSLFYLFNPGAVQQFYAPFEMFTTQYAALPWIVLFSFKYLEDPKNKKNLWLFGLVTLLATPQAYAAHLWYAFFGVYILFIFVYSAINGGWTHFRKAAILLVLTLLINSFWLLPNLYYIATSSSVPKESKQNRIFSQEYRIRNQENGYIQDVSLAKGFYFQWSAFNFENNHFEYLMPEWRDHLKNPVVAGIGYVFFVLSLFGIYLSFKQKNKVLISLLPFYILPFVLLMNSTPPFSWFFTLLLKLSLFEEALRFVFTKLSILLIFGYAIYFSYALSWVLSKLKNSRQILSLFAFFIGAILVFGLPLLRGYLISDKFKVTIPNHYFKLWNYMETQPNQPVLTLPLHTFSGWQYYDWPTAAGRQGYQGSGLIWFGMKQPVLDRDSDRWSIANEQAFRELQYTLYSQHTDQFYSTLKKYHIGYLLWDAAVITPTEKNRDQILYQRETTEAIKSLTNSHKLERINQFGSVQIYKVFQTDQAKIMTVQSQVEPAYRWNFVDQAYLDHGEYITSGQLLTRNYNYPFRDFLTPTDRIKPSLASSISDLKHSIVFTARRLIKNQDVQNVISLKDLGGTQVIELKTKNFTKGIAVQNETFPHNLGYVLGFRSRNIKGLPLRFCLKNLYSNLCDTYDELSHSSTMTDDYFVIPPYESGHGYGLYIDNISYGDYESINDLESVTIYPLYYNYLSAQYDTSGHNKDLNVLHNNEAFNAGWIAFAVKNDTWNIEILKQHVLVNNWENGWILPPELSPDSAESRIPTVSRETKNYELITIFWPQYLEYLGFVLLVCTVVLIWKKQA